MLLLKAKAALSRPHKVNQKRKSCLATSKTDCTAFKVTLPQGKRRQILKDNLLPRFGQITLKHIKAMNDMTTMGINDGNTETFSMVSF